MITRIVRIYIGLRDQNNRLIHDIDDVISIVNSRFGSATIYNGIGLFTTSLGERISEPCIIVELFGYPHSIDIQKVNKTAADIKEALNQETVLITTSEVNAYEI